MPRIRVTNETDEAIVLDPGETLDLFGSKDRSRIMAGRMNTFSVKSIRERP